ncbi:MAG TPA: hypothetical protein DCQ32_00900 [Cyanobacteria bacterium UBA8156]|jgi:hypothetical protein|nr:hypothetical protein [Cyanobacteria bacterium UBA8156]
MSAETQPDVILGLSFDEGSYLALRHRAVEDGGYTIEYTFPEDEPRVVATLSDDLDINLAKSLFFTIAEDWARFDDDADYLMLDEGDEGEEDEEED